jgi:toxin-antitoxin system PIN domain toxin
MIIPDANLLIYAHDSKSTFHTQAKSWWEETLNGTESIGIPWVVLMAFTRLLTHPHLCTNPLSIEQVRSLVDEWLLSPELRIIQLSENALAGYFDLLEEAGIGGNLSTDAHIALHAREYSATIFSNDRDFDRFTGIKWVNPLQ